MTKMYKPRVLVMIPSLRPGGAERVLLNFLERADQKRFDITLLVISKQGELQDQIPNGIRVVYLFQNPSLERFINYLFRTYGWVIPYRLAIYFRRLVGYDLGISYQDSKYTDLLFHIKELGRRICWVHSAMDTNPNYVRYLQNDSYRVRLQSERYEKLDEIIFVSETAKRSFFKLYDISLAHKARVVSNVMNSERIVKLAAEEPEVKKTTFSFVALGSLLPVKGFDRLIRAGKILADKGHDFEIFIIGKGPEKGRLKELLLSLELGGQVTLLGFRRNPYPVLKSCDVFIMTSISEAMPTALCEAFILGKPVITTRCAATEEFTSNGEYCLMSEQDDESLAEKMELILKNPSLRNQYATLSLRRATLFSDETAVENYHSILSGN